MAYLNGDAMSGFTPDTRDSNVDRKVCRALIRLLGVKPGGQSSVTAEELQMLFAEATRSAINETGYSPVTDEDNVALRAIFERARDRYYDDALEAASVLDPAPLLANTLVTNTVLDFS